ncbi:hypothetical protein VB776_06685 [Arcicella sp. DC2W]|uniref:Lipoprotein n=1 Tax=Arcicella gelida TaxID=2984195 RepID=A0ABU5S296_9BACT|nr:hypothetical protein [Arcicella sp. DC2W]MEA5402592.1 hypothetical protein [Arcicella sp. DC2W]
MKKSIIVLSSIIALFISSCSSVNHNRVGQGVNTIDQAANIQNLKKEDIIVGKNVESDKTYSKVWFLFIPFGGKSEETRRERVYLQACKQNQVDGILQPKYETKRFFIPLILFTYVNYNTSVLGKGYNIKTDK